MSTYKTIETGDLVPRVYGEFRGIDATKRDVTLTRSPDALNMWVNYKASAGKCIETRPGMESYLDDITGTIYGMYFYEVGSNKMMIIHSGTKLYKYQNETLTELFTGMNVKRSYFFVYNNMLYIKDGLNYLKYDGVNIGQVVGFIPTTSIGGIPKTHTRTSYMWVNTLSDYRYNTFCGDGESTIYETDVESFDADYTPEVVVTTLNETTSLYEEITYTPLVDYTWDSTKGTITFTRIPGEPATTGQDNVKIKIKKSVLSYRNRINGCTIHTIFNGSVFMAGHPDYPNMILWSRQGDPSYIPDLFYDNDGLDIAKTKALISGNNALWVLKEPNQANTTIFYHTPVYTTDKDRGLELYAYPSTNSSISLGCISTGINFNDDIVFYSDRGLEGISSDITTEQAVNHRSTLIDALLLNEEDYKDMILEEWEGYLLTIIGKKVYLADSRSRFNISDHNEYDFFYWELDEDITSTLVKDGVLYLGTENGIYTLTDESEDREITSYWTTPDDDFKVGRYVKTTSKRGCVINMKGEEISIYTKTDNNEYEFINTYTNTKDYVVCRIKRKKWKTISVKMYSDKPFGVYSMELQSYVGGYVKR